MSVGMNVHARNKDLPPLSFVDDAGSANDAQEPGLSAELEQNLAELPTLPRLQADATRPASPQAANAPAMPTKLELALEPLEAAPVPEPPPAVVVPTPVSASVAAPEPASAPTGSTVDRYLAEATREFEAGQVDQPLWMRAVTKAEGDEVAARRAYLTARATAIRIARRETRHERAERRTRTIDELLAEPHAGVQGRGVADLFTRRRLAAALGVAALLVVGGIWFAVGDSGAPPSTVAAAAPGAKPGAGAAKGAAQPVAPVPTATASEAAKSQVQELADKVKDLATAGNWNVLVLHATEWTRKAPEDPDAWLALGAGFMHLKQHYEAAEALARATTLAPQRPEAWHGLGEAKAAWGATDEAIAAYERAVAIDDRDIASIVQLGLLHAGGGDFAKAKDALDRALALNAADVEALCASAAVAQKAGRAKDAQGYAQKAKSLGAECPEVAPEPPAAPVRVVGGKQPAAQPSARR